MLTLPPHFRKQLEARLEQLLMGELQMHELPPEIAAWYVAGWSEARAQAKSAAHEYEHKLDLAYIQMMHPKEKAAEIRRRMIEHFEREERLFFAGVEGLENDSSGNNATEIGTRDNRAA